MTNETEDNNFRKTLLTEYARRQNRNSSYSLRAFARALGVSPTSLSLVLNGKRKFSENSLREVVQKLGLSPIERRQFLRSASGNENLAKEAGNAGQAYCEFDLDHFLFISEWYHFAILSLGDIRRNEWSVTWISQRLGISRKEAQDAMARMLRLNLISLSGNSFKQSKEKLFVQSKTPAPAIQKYHRQNLEKATLSISENDVSERDISSITFASTSEKIDKARDMIREFREELAAFLETKANDRVYTLAIQLFPVSK